MVLVAVLAAGLSGCEHGADTDPLVTGSTEGEDLVGFWTGTERLAGMDDEVRGVDRGQEEAFSFRVALRLRANQTFRFWAFNFPVGAQTEQRVCEGVWEREGRILEFFPETVCRPLPLSRYAIGRFFPDGLTLEARTNAGPGGPAAGSIRVRIRLERD